MNVVASLANFRATTEGTLYVGLNIATNTGVNASADLTVGFDDTANAIRAAVDARIRAVVRDLTGVTMGGQDKIRIIGI